MAASTKRAWKLQEFIAHGSNVNCLALGHKSGHVMVTGGEDRKVNMWAVGKPNCIMSLSGHTSPVESVRFNNAEDKVIAGSMSGALKIWDLEAAKIVRTLTGHKSGIRSLDFHPFGDFVASGSLDTNIKLWDTRRKGCIFTYKGHTNCVNSLRFSPDGKWLASAGEDGLVKLWDLSMGKLLTDFKQHTAAVNSIEFHPNEFLLASGSSDRTVKFWDLGSLKMVGTTEVESSAVRSVIFHPDGICIYCAAQDTLKVYGWEPVRTFDSLVMNWGKVADVSIAQTQLIGAAFSQTNVSAFVADIQRVQPLGGPPSPGITASPQQVSVNTASARKIFTERPPTRSTKQAPTIVKEEPEDISPEDPGDEDNSADIKNQEEYQQIFQPKTKRLEHSPTRTSNNPFPAPPEDVPASVPVVAAVQESVKSPRPVPKPAALDANEFLPKQAIPSINQEATNPDMSDSEALSSIAKGHESMFAVMNIRHKNIQIVRALWTAGNTKTAMESAMGMNDQAIIVDVLNVLAQKHTLWSLDLCALLLPEIEKLLISKYENYVICGCAALKVILKNFSSVIKANLVAPPSLGVDISREERYRKCKSCYGILMNIRSSLEQKQTSQGKIGNTFRQLQLMMGGLE